MITVTVTCGECGRMKLLDEFNDYHSLNDWILPETGEILAEAETPEGAMILCPQCKDTVTSRVPDAQEREANDLVGQWLEE